MGERSSNVWCYALSSGEEVGISQPAINLHEETMTVGEHHSRGCGDGLVVWMSCPPANLAGGE